MNKYILILLAITSMFLFCGKEEEKSKTVYNVSRDKGALFRNRNAHVEKRYLEIIKKDPGNFSALVILGNHYFDTNRLKKAIEMYRRALVINPNNANIRTDMGIMYRKTGDFKAAVKEFRRAARSNKKHYQSRFNLGITLYNDLKDNKGAIAAFEDMLKVYPQHPEAAGIRKFIDNLKKTPQHGSILQKPELDKSKESEGWIK